MGGVLLECVLADEVDCGRLDHTTTAMMRIIPVYHFERFHDAG